MDCTTLIEAVAFSATTLHPNGPKAVAFTVMNTLQSYLVSFAPNTIRLGYEAILDKIFRNPCLQDHGKYCFGCTHNEQITHFRPSQEMSAEMTLTSGKSVGKAYMVSKKLLSVQMTSWP